MTIILPEISRQIKSKDIFTIIEKRYSEIGPIWMPMQLEWVNSVYLTFNDYTKFMIIMHLMSKTFNFYSKNFVKLDFESFFSQNQVEIEKLNIIEISKSLNIPKETTRRKIIELGKMGTIKKLKKKIIIDKNTWPNIKPQDTIKRMSRFLSVLSKILYTEKIISESITSDELTKVSKDNFSFVWKLYYDMQMPMLLNNKAIIGDLESFHIWGLCVVNQVLNSKKNDNSQMTREGYLKKYIFSSNYKGVNAMSISEITGIPRATVIRKLNRMIKINFLKFNNKKQYSTTGLQQKKFKEIQKINLINLSKFAERIYNLYISK